MVGGCGHAQPTPVAPVAASERAPRPAPPPGLDPAPAAASAPSPATAPVPAAVPALEPPPSPVVAPAETPRPVALPVAAAPIAVPAVATPAIAGLKPGAVKMIQQRLESAGSLQAQDATGQLDALTHAALARFQQANELPPTGEPDEATVRKLGLEPTNIFEELAPGTSN
jgi:hypothetical protein